MGNKMTSTPYGLKLKERTNHADYKDIFEDVVFKIYYNESTHVWTIKSNYDRLWSDGIQYRKGDTILEFTNSLTQEKAVLGQYDQEGTSVYRNIMYRIKCYQGEAGVGVTKQLIQITGGYSPKTYDKETVCTDILYTHTKIYYNGKWHIGMYLLYDNPSIANCWMKKVGALAITYAKPYWFLMTTQAGIEYGGQTYEARKLIRSWSPDDPVNMSLYYHQIRKRQLQNPDTDKFDKLVYDVQCFAPDGTVTLTYEINQVSQDSVTVTPSDSPVTFHNIEMRADSNKWTFYSKCGYIKFDGKTYKTNKSIFSVGFDEDLHVEIKDESNIYEIEETTTYTVKSVQVGSISYKLWTTTIDKTIKIEKTVDAVVEPWTTIRYYEAMYEPVTIDDLIIEFSNTDMKWYLKSNNDDLYCNGSNYKKGELIDYWDYDYIQNFKYITVLVSSSEDGIEIKKISSGDVPYLNNDIDEVYDDGIKVCHSSTKGLWEIVSVDDETYYNGIQFLKGQTIISFKDKTIIDQFIILVSKEIEGGGYDNVRYTCYTSVDIINGITTFTANGRSWTDKSATDANKSVIVTKDTARSMYGYIWVKEETPPPPVWSTFYLLYTEFYWGTGVYNKYGSLRFIDDRDLQNINCKKYFQISGFRYNPYRVIWYEYSFLNRVFISYEYTSGTHWLYICDNISDNNPNFVLLSSFETEFWISFIKSKSTIVGKKRNDVSYYYEYTIFSDNIVNKTLEKYIPDILSESSNFLNSCNYSSGLFIKEFGNKVIYYADYSSNRFDNFEVFVYDPYNDTMDEYFVWYSSYEGIPELQSYIESNSWNNYNRYHIQPSDVGKTNSYVSYNDSTIGAYDASSLYVKDNGPLAECSTFKKFFFNNAFYSYGIIYQTIYEARINLEFGNTYEAEVSYEEHPVIIKITPNGTSLKFLSELSDYYIRPKGMRNSIDHRVLPDSYFLFYAGGYYFGNTKYFVGQKVNKIYDPESGKYEYEYLNIYGIFRFNAVTETVEKVKEINGINSIYINEIDIATGKNIGTRKFYYGYNDHVTENDHWIFYQTTEYGGNYSALHDYEGSECGAFTGRVCSYVNVSGSLATATKDKLIFRIPYSNKFLYVVFDNPEFNMTIGNYCFYVDQLRY